MNAAAAAKPRFSHRLPWRVKPPHIGWNYSSEAAMDQIGLVTGITVGASVMMLYEIWRRAAAGPRKSRRRTDGGDSSTSDSGSSLLSGDSGCEASDSGGSCDGGGDSGGGD
jgi:hypothetical protein